MSEESLNDISEELYQVPYYRLSAWGKRNVKTELRKRQEGSVDAVLPAEPDSATLRRENERLSRALESAQLENLDLWKEVTDLKTELADLRAELNLPDTT